MRQPTDCAECCEGLFAIHRVHHATKKYRGVAQKMSAVLVVFVSLMPLEELESPKERVLGAYRFNDSLCRSPGFSSASIVYNISCHIISCNSWPAKRISPNSHSKLPDEGSREVFNYEKHDKAIKRALDAGLLHTGELSSIDSQSS